MYFNIQEQIIISMMLEGHCREGTNASPFHDFANLLLVFYKKTLNEQRDPRGQSIPGSRATSTLLYA